MLKKSLVTTALALAVAAWATPASALTIHFDPTGAGGPGLAITALDPTVGNSIALGATGASIAGTPVTALFQANLTSGKNGSTSVAFGHNFGVVAGFHEVVTSNAGGTVRLLLDGSQPSFFNIYALPADGNDLTGLGFINGTPILSGVFINSGAPGDGVSVFNITGGGVPLDAANGNDDYPGQTTIVGGGSFDTTVRITGVNAGYFPDLTIGSTLALVTSQLKLNYDQADPSQCFSNNGTVQCNQAGATLVSVGANNGSSGPNTVFQTDASASFTAAAVPEPATLTLLGVGLLASVRRRRNLAKK